ncbi:MAG: DUF1045 domain-containing protein [Hyphomicrobiales bacterium]|nr:DUF1045 domain-containing protein [Hyphomicrobiales bacterium]
MSAPRYAIYLAPPPDSPLWRFGSHVLGYDAATGQDVHGFALPGVDPETWRHCSDRPRLYGFHATLKAPFRLADGCSVPALKAALADFAAATPAFDLGPLAVTCLKQANGGFVALTPEQASPDLARLEAATVMHFDPFRAPLTEAERAARHPERLTARERDHLERWGYPHVLDAFRFHMTLTNLLAHPDKVAALLSESLAADIGPARLAVDALVLFEQAAPGARFRIISRAEMAGS